MYKTSYIDTKFINDYSYTTIWELNLKFVLTKVQKTNINFLTFKSFNIVFEFSTPKIKLNIIFEFS